MRMLRSLSLLLICGSFLLAFPAPTSAQTADTVIFGDSITQLSTAQVVAKYGLAGHQITVDAYSDSGLDGNTFYSANFWPNHMKEINRTGVKWQTVIIELGTNDSGGPTYPDWGTKAQYLLSLVPVAPGGRVFWVNVREVNLPAHLYAPTINAYINSLVPQITVIDMNAYFANHPEAFLPDQIHPTPLGSVMYADMLVAATTK